MKGLGTIIWLQLLGIISAVTAINPQFQRVTGKITAGGAHQVEWTETGLGNNQNINYRIEAGASSTWACFINAGKISNKQNFREPVEKSVTHNSGKNGRVDAVEIIGPVPPSSGFSCPPGQDTFLLGVSYANVMVTDTTNGVKESETVFSYYVGEQKNFAHRIMVT
ncbi:hypothetical protein H9L39_02320 [Fusarium oxysporum f. sp. albedinis]|nr:hypothetical protein FOMA001_g2164 [Fusarium oxysporum f. sp. matthiolae]KAK2488393.1 hypothetical protein H9L39_02320 [Fusarium oxysporum f. sp. albedinis]